MVEGIEALSFGKEKRERMSAKYWLDGINVFWSWCFEGRSRGFLVCLVLL
jgi:hypothetical protein